MCVWGEICPVGVVATEARAIDGDDRFPFSGCLGDRRAGGERKSKPRSDGLFDGAQRVDDHEVGTVDHPERPAASADEWRGVLYERPRDIRLRDCRRKLRREPLDAGSHELSSFRLAGLGDRTLPAPTHRGRNSDDHARSRETDRPARDGLVGWCAEHGRRLEEINQPPNEPVAIAATPGPSPPYQAATATMPMRTVNTGSSAAPVAKAVTARPTIARLMPTAYRTRLDACSVPRARGDPHVNPRSRRHVLANTLVCHGALYRGA